MSDIVGQIALELGIDAESLTEQLTGVADSAAKEAESLTEQLTGAADSAAKEADKSLTSAFTGIGKKIGGILAGLALGSFTKECLDLGSDLAEVQNVVDTAFKTMSSDINAFATASMKEFGLSETIAKQYMGTIGAMNNAFGFTEAESVKMAEAVTGLVGDVASFYNLDPSESFTKLKSIWTGETETLKDLGVVMTQTALDQYALNNGFGKATANMTEQEKVLLRYQFVTESLSDAVGDFAKTQDSWANQTRILSLQTDSLKASLGQGFIYAFTPAINCLNLLMEKLVGAAECFKNFMAVITGNSEETESFANVATGAEESVEEVDSLTSSLEEAKREMAGFDKITKLSGDSEDSEDSDSGLGSYVSLTGTTQVDMDTDMEDVLDNLKKVMEHFQNWAVKNFGPSFKNIWKDFQKNTGDFKRNLAKVFQDIKTLGVPLTEYFQGSFTECLVTAFDTAGKTVNGLYDTFNMVFADIWNLAVFPYLDNFVRVGLPMFTEFTTQSIVLTGTLFTELKSCFDMLWSEGVRPALILITDMWIGLMNTLSDFWKKWGTPVFDGINAAVKSTGKIFRTIWSTMLKPVWDNIMIVVDEIWKKHLQPLLANFLDFVGEFVTGATTIYNGFVAPLVQVVSEILGPVVIAIFNSIANIIGTMIGTACDLVNGFITTLKGFVQFLKGVFTLDVSMALTGIQNIFQGIFDGLVVLIKTPVNYIIDVLNGMVDGVVAGINTVIRAVNKLSFTVPDWVPGIGGEKFGFDFEEVTAARIPKLAQGGYVKPNTPQLAMIGDNRHQGEVVAPEDKLTEMAIAAAKAAGGGGISKAELEAVVNNAVLRIVSALGRMGFYIGSEEIAKAVMAGMESLDSRYNPVKII